MTTDDHAEILRLRERIHQIVDSTSAQLRSLEAELHKLNVHFERELAILKEQNRGLSAQIEEQSKDTNSLRRGVYTLAFSAIGASVVFAFAVFQLTG